MIKWLIRQLQKFDKDTYTDDLPKEDTKKEKREEPRIEITGFAVNPDDPSQGAFEFDWNKTFIHQLVSEGYTGRSDEDLVEQWFSDVCRNVVLETYEQEKARIGELPDFDPDTSEWTHKPSSIIKQRNLGDNRSEFE